jgi:hypothetical protein
VAVHFANQLGYLDKLVRDLELKMPIWKEAIDFRIMSRANTILISSIFTVHDKDGQEGDQSSHHWFQISGTLS